MDDVARQFRIPDIPEQAGALSLKGAYVRSLSDLLPQVRVDASRDAENGRLLQCGETLDGVVVFIDMGSYTERTKSLEPQQTAFLANKFFHRLGKLSQAEFATFDKTIGDCVMLVLSKALGCQSPDLSAVRLALHIIGLDTWSFDPHVGMAKGKIWLGLNGPPFAMSLSVYGTPVNLAARLLGKSAGNTMLLPTDMWESVRSEISLPDSFTLNNKRSAKSAPSDDFVKDFPSLCYTSVARTTIFGPVMGEPGDTFVIA